MPLSAMVEWVSADPKATLAVLSPFVTFGLNRLFSPSAKLFHSIRHRFHYLINEPLLNAEGKVIRPTQGVAVQSLSVSNNGRVPATKCEIVFNWRPSYVNIWPVRSFSEEDLPDGRYVIKVENLAPKEVFGVELLCLNRDIPSILTVRSAEVESIERTMIPQIQYSRAFSAAVITTLIFGIMSLVYFALSVLEFALR